MAKFRSVVTAIAIAIALGGQAATVAAQSLCPTTVRFEGDPTHLDLDVGWTGRYHDQEFLGLILTMEVGCSAGATPPNCGLCTLAGPILNADADTGGIHTRRCIGNTRVKCTTDGECAGAGGLCRFFFGAPLPISANAVPVCVINEITAQITGTINPDDGSVAAIVPLQPTVHNGVTQDSPCPRCVGDTTQNDGVRAGTCDAGMNEGLTCDVNATARYAPWGDVSYDCPPIPGSAIGQSVLAPVMHFSTDLLSVQVTADSPPCTDVGFPTKRCLCDTCNNSNAEPCMKDATCPTSGGLPGVCGGLRCLTGASTGEPCTPGNLPCSSPGVCGRPGQPTAPNSCVSGCTPDPSDLDSIDEGVCAVPFDSVCPTDQYHPCATAGTDCAPPQSPCKSKSRECFNDNGALGGTVLATGHRNVPTLLAAPSAYKAELAWAALECLAPTTSLAVNEVAGLPGLGRVSVYGACGRLPYQCGNGVREGAEACDNGSPNCSSDCLTCLTPTHIDGDNDLVDDGCDNCVNLLDLPHSFNPDQRNSDCPSNGTGPGCDKGDVCDPCPTKPDDSSCNQALSGGKNIGPAGDTLTFGPSLATEPPNATITIVVPAGAVLENTSFSLTNDVANNLIALPNAAFRFELQPTLQPTLQPKVPFCKPIEVTLGWADLNDNGKMDQGLCQPSGSPTCDLDSYCLSNDCMPVGGADEADLKLKKNGNSFNYTGIGIGVVCGGTPDLCKCPAHNLTSPCTTATANCSNPDLTGKATVARCCDQGPTGPNANTWEFETCYFSSFIMSPFDPIPGGGSPRSDCVSEWIVQNRFNVPEVDDKGLTNRKQTCVDGDSSCDGDGAVNGSCTFRVSVCVNNEDGRLLHKGEPACAPSDVAVWELKKPRPDSPKAVDAANAVALRGALQALGASTVGGDHQGLVTFTPALTEHDLCSALANVEVPLRGPGKKGRAMVRTRATTSAPAGSTKGTKDTDTLKLFCLPPP